MPLYRDIFLPSYIKHCSHIPHTFNMTPGPDGGIGNHGSAEWLIGARSKLELCIKMCEEDTSEVVCISDVDMLWVGNPQNELSEIEEDQIYVTRDNLVNDRINSGVIAFRPSYKVLSMLSYAFNHAKMNNLDDQDAMEATLETKMLPLSFCNTKTIGDALQHQHVCYHPTVSQPSDGISSHTKKMSHIFSVLENRVDT